MSQKAQQRPITKLIRYIKMVLVGIIIIPLAVWLLMNNWSFYMGLHKSLVTQKYELVVSEIEHAGSDTLIDSSVPPVTEDHRHYPDDGRELHPGCLSTEGYLFFRTNKPLDQALHDYSTSLNKVGWQPSQPYNQFNVLENSDHSLYIRIIPYDEQWKTNFSSRSSMYKIEFEFGDPSVSDCFGV